MSMHLVRYIGEARARWYDEGWWSADTCPGLLAHAARREPGGLAMVDRHHRVSWSDLQRAACWFATRFAEAGVDRGDTAIVHVADGVVFAAAMLGAQAVGAVPVPMLRSAGPAEIETVVRRVAARAYVGETPPGMVVPLVVEVDPGDLPVAGPDEPFPVPGYVPDPDAVSDIMFTSGTTGDAKGVMNSHNTKLCGLRGFLAEFTTSPDEVWGIVAPMVHNAGWLYSFLPALATGRPSVVIPRGDRDAIVDGMAAEGVTVAFLVPTHAIDVLESCRVRHMAPNSTSLRTVLTGAAAAPPGLVRGLAEEVGVEVVSMYGMTECQANLFTRPGDPVSLVESSVGRPCPGAEVGLRSTDGAWIGEDGLEGEIMTRGPVVFLGYFDDQTATTATFTKDGWLRSGDLAVRRNGNYEVVGRIKDVILRGGATVSPAEVEDAISPYPGFEEVAVVGLPDPRLGERICACVIGEDASLEDLHGWMRERGVGRGLWPDALIFRTEFPSTALGKVQRAALKRQILEEEASP